MPACKRLHGVDLGAAVTLVARFQKMADLSLVKESLS